jgi:rubredoxin
VGQHRRFGHGPPFDKGHAMPQVVAYDDIPPETVVRHRGKGGDAPSADVYPFMGSHAFLVRYVPGSNSSAHFHEADQIQIIVEGRGRLGHHPMSPYQVHFSRAFTPYGPLVPHEGEGWAFINLRTRPDPHGPQRLSMARDKLLKVPNRRPFQGTYDVDFPIAQGQPVIVPIEGLKNDEGLEGFALTLPPKCRHAAPSPASSDGQYLVITDGSLVWDGRTYKALTIVQVPADEGPFEVHAGDQGLQAMIINFPLVGAPLERHVPGAPPAVARADQVWQCVLCDFHYDEAKGLPESGIAPGTPWQDVPADWTCPDCGARKPDFEKLEF